MMNLREIWADGQPTFGAWLSSPSSSVAETAARCGADFVCCDNQHGATDYASTVTAIQGVLLGGSRPIVRVPWNEPGIIGKMLDAGAQGVVVPMVNTEAEADSVVRACRYPPRGDRSYGPVLAGIRAADYHVHANATIATIPMIETVQALRNLDAILSVDGVDAIYVGPADLSFSLGLPPANNDDDDRFTDALVAIVAACRRHGVVPGIHASGALAARRLEQGFRMITVTSDLVSIRTRMSEELAQARGAAGPEGSNAVY